MKVLSIMALKGGVAKTISAINIAHILATVHLKRVLLVDNDKQGNASKFFKAHSYDAPSIADVLTVKGFNIADAIKGAGYLNLDILPANMNLLRANKEILLDCSRPQQTRLKKALEAVADVYDYVVIDNAPDLNMSVINALVACDDVMIPVKIDQFAFDGLAQICDQIEDVREFNPDIRLVGSFITMYQKNNVNREGERFLMWQDEAQGIPTLNTVIRKTVKVDETTFAGVPLLVYAPRSTATQDYVALVKEYLSMGARKG